MSQHEPTKPYVYQPLWAAEDYVGLNPNPKIYAIGGPGSEPYEGQLFTSSEALKIVERLVRENAS